MWSRLVKQFIEEVVVEKELKTTKENSKPQKTELKTTKDNLLDSQNKLNILQIHSDKVESKSLERHQTLKLTNKENKHLKIKKCPDGHILDDKPTRDEMYWYCDRCDENSKRLNEEDSKEEKEQSDDNETEKDLPEDENDDNSNISEMSSEYVDETIFYREPNESMYQCSQECGFMLCTKCYNLCEKCYNL